MTDMDDVEAMPTEILAVSDDEEEIRRRRPLTGWISVIGGMLTCASAQTA